MEYAMTPDFTQQHENNHTRPNICAICQHCHNEDCAIKQILVLIDGIDCDILFRILDKYEVPCKYRLMREA
jgi:hypothetical protein